MTEAERRKKMIDVAIRFHVYCFGHHPHLMLEHGIQPNVLRNIRHNFRCLAAPNELFSMLHDMAKRAGL
jgi:hypothetical protein